VEETPLSDATEALLRDLVIANRILARENVVDDFGHVSARDPADPRFFWLSRSKSPELVERDDLIRFDLDGVPQDPGHRKPYLETILHARIYAARPDVNAIVHHHARAVLPFTMLPIPLRPVFHLGALIGPEVPLWDSRHEFGDTALIVDTAPMADSLARAMGPHPTALLARHGAVCAEADLKRVVFTAIYMAENAALQMAALAHGTPDYLSPGEIAKTRAMQFGERPLSRAWAYRSARAGFGGI
jgi:HCOMODA/2-hydroxy-3-carboxy-muconic semialdehyde decarboxylase